MKVLSAVLVGFIFTINSLPQKDARTVAHQAAPKLLEPMISVPSSGTSSLTPSNATLITKMWNAYSTQGPFTNQIYFDPYSNVLAVVHRTDRTGLSSGHIVYRLSDDFGANWSGQIGPANPNPPTNGGRHPNIVISNPLKSTTTDEVVVSMGIAGLGVTWKYAAMITDTSILPPIFVYHVDSVFYPADEMTVDNHGNIYANWPTSEPWWGDSLAQNVLFRSTDRGVTWQKSGIDKASDYNSFFNGTKIEFGNGDVGYIMVQGQNPAGDYDFGLKKTTNSGQTWDANWNWVNWKSVQYGSCTLGDSVHALNYEVDLIVHGLDHPFLGGTFVDTADGSATGIYVISNVGTGWKATLIKKVNTTFLILPGSLSALNEVEFSREKNGDVLALKFIDVVTSNDTMPDIYMSWYIANSWTHVNNISQSNSIKEKFTQFASRCWRIDTELTPFVVYTIFGDNDQNDLAEAELWLHWVLMDIIENPVEFPNDYKLSNNYPNPFNPTTTIDYTIGKSGHVKLEILNSLGQVVAVLANEVQSAGSQRANFSAKNLPSGVYYYKLTAGEFIETKKMILLR